MITQSEIDYGTFEEELQGIAFDKLIDFVLAKEDIPQNAQVSLAFISEDEITELNAQYRDIDQPTDVLSFECDAFDEDALSERDPDEPLILGDILIAPEVARVQAKQYTMSFDEELSFLLIHGLLHLCGYDHIDEDEAQLMEQREQELFQQWFKTDKLLR